MAQNNQSNIVITLHRKNQMDPKQQLHKIKDAICFECGSIDDQRLLLCDMCDGGYHLSCVRPPLTRVPDGPWYCHSCSHLSRPLTRSSKLKKCRALLQNRRRKMEMMQEEEDEQLYGKQKKAKKEHE